MKSSGAVTRVNPLRRRVWREVWWHKARYGGLFLLLSLVVAMSTGFLSAAHSIENMARTIHDEYNVEDGQFTIAEPLSEQARETMHALGLTLVDNYSLDVPLVLSHSDTRMQVRLCENRTDMNLANYVAGRAPHASNEIALTRVFTQNNGISVGDTVYVDDTPMTVSGIMTMSDVTATFKKNTDFVFNAVTFAYGHITPEAFRDFSATNTIAYTYSYRHDEALTRQQRADMQSEIVETLAGEGANIVSIIDYEDNQSISYALNDIQSDQNMWFVLLVLLMIILAFVLIVLTNSTIEASSASIGTLLANGYRKSELVRHYAAPALIVGFVAAFVGNILGYAFMLRPMLNIYYANYDYPPAVFVWSWKIFTKTTVIPLLLLAGIVYVGLAYSLRATPLDFLRGITRVWRGGVRSMLPGFLPFASRFRLRLIGRNVGHFVTLFFGICFGSFLLIFSFGLIPTMQHYAQAMASDMPAQYLYTLKTPVDIDDSGSGGHTGRAERFAVASMTTPRAIGSDKENISLYGVVPESAYWADTVHVNGNNVVIGGGLSEKTGIRAGDTIVLSEKSSGKEHALRVHAVTGSATDMNAYMNNDSWNAEFDMPEGYFNGYASNTKLDIPREAQLAVLTPADMEAIGTQMEESFSGMAKMIIAIAIPIYIVLMFLLTKVVIERSARSISYMKVFGYRDREVDSLYVRPITIATIIFLGVSMPVLLWILDGIILLALSGYDGNISAYVTAKELAYVYALGLASYAIVAFAHIRSVRKVSLALALKTQE